MNPIFESSFFVVCYTHDNFRCRSPFYWKFIFDRPFFRWTSIILFLLRPKVLLVELLAWIYEANVRCVAPYPRLDLRQNRRKMLKLHYIWPDIIRKSKSWSSRNTKSRIQIKQCAYIFKAHGLVIVEFEKPPKEV